MVTVGSVICRMKYEMGITPSWSQTLRYWARPVGSCSPPSSGAARYTLYLRNICQQITCYIHHKDKLHRYFFNFIGISLKNISLVWRRPAYGAKKPGRINVVQNPQLSARCWKAFPRETRLPWARLELTAAVVVRGSWLNERRGTLSTSIKEGSPINRRINVFII